MGAKRIGYKENEDGLTARLYVDCGAEMSAELLRRFSGASSAPAPQRVADSIIIDIDPKAPVLPGAGNQLRVTWRR